MLLATTDVGGLHRKGIVLNTLTTSVVDVKYKAHVLCSTNGHPWWVLCGMVGGVGRLSFPDCQGTHAEQIALVGAFSSPLLPGSEVSACVQCRVQYSCVSAQREVLSTYR